MLFLRRDPYLRALNNWSPFEELNRMRREMERLTDGITRGYTRGSHAGVFPLMNLTEDKDSYYIRAELPGVNTGDIDLSVTGDSISITGERKNQRKLTTRSTTGEKGNQAGLTASLICLAR
jgi:HSP20 family molecular chaperone IbpA